MRSAVIAITSVVFSCPSVSANDDVLLRAVGFSVTGSDDADAKILNRANCVFRVGNDTYHFNNIDTDRLNMKNWEQKFPAYIRHFTSIELHGDNIVYETVVEPQFKADGTANMEAYKKAMPELFKTQHFSYRERALEIDTNEPERLARAWTYIYSNGCTSAKSSF